jgi:hypothetical protein
MESNQLNENDFNIFLLLKFNKYTSLRVYIKILNYFE